VLFAELRAWAALGRAKPTAESACSTAETS
jgi:hypothetical protein